MSVQPAEKPKRSRRWKWTRRIVFGIVVLLSMTVLGSWIWYEHSRWQGKKELAAAIAETNAADPHWRWEQLEEEKSLIPDAENSILVLRHFHELTAGWSPNSLKTRDVQELLSTKPANERVDEESRLVISRELTANNDGVKLALSLKDHPHGRAKIALGPKVLDTRLDHLDHGFALASLLRFEIEQLLTQKREDDAIDVIHAILNVSSAFRYDSTGISHVRRISVRRIALACIERVLGTGTPSDVALRKLSVYLTRELDENILSQGIRAERALINKVFESLEQRTITVVDVEQAEHTFNPGYFEARLYSTIVRTNLPADHAHFLRLVREAESISNAPIAERFQRWRVFSDRMNAERCDSSILGRHFITWLSYPLFSSLGWQSTRDLARLVCTMTAIAAERFRIVRKRWPNQLAELCPDFIAEVPVDPFDGQLLKLAIRDDGIVIYSVGLDGTDDGGHTLIEHKANSDLGFRIWNPERRNLPAAKPPRIDNEER